MVREERKDSRKDRVERWDGEAGKEEEGEERQGKGEWEREGRVGEDREDVLERRVICTWLSDVCTPNVR